MLVLVASWHELIYEIFISVSYQTGCDTRSFYSGGFKEGKVGHELRRVPCWTMLVKESQGAM